MHFKLEFRKYNPYNSSALSIILNLPAQVDQMERENIERSQCVKENRCSQYYWQSSTGLWLTHRYTEDEITDQVTAQSKDVKQCLELKNCVSYQNKELKETFVHRYSAEELEIIKQNQVQIDAKERLKCINDGLCVYVSGKGTRFFTSDELEDLQTRQSKDADQRLKENKFIVYQIKGSPVILYRTYSDDALKNLESNDSYEIKTAQQEEERLKKVRDIGWFD